VRKYDEATARHRDVADEVHADESGVEVNNLRSCRCQDIDGARTRVRVQSFHVNDALIFRGFGFGQVRVNSRRFSGVRVHVEKRRVKRRQKERRDDAAGRQLPHGVILMNTSFESQHFVMHFSISDGAP
jgi:hypothetical protein